MKSMKLGDGSVNDNRRIGEWQEGRRHAHLKLLNTDPDQRDADRQAIASPSFIRVMADTPERHLHGTCLPQPFSPFNKTRADSQCGTSDNGNVAANGCRWLTWRLRLALTAWMPKIEQCSMLTSNGFNIERGRTPCLTMACLLNGKSSAQ